MTAITASRSSTPPIPTDYERLEQLFAIQTVLAQPGDLEHTFDELLPLMTRILRIRTAVVLDTMPYLERALMWAASGIPPADVEQALDQARKSLGYLHRTAKPTLVRRTALLPGGVADLSIGPRFVSLPLVVQGGVLGVFQIEAAAALDERDLMFINVVANQIAITLDRHHVQQQLETSRAELECVNRWLRELYDRKLAAIRSRDVVLGVVSHDLRNPLSAIQLCTGMIAADAPALAKPVSIIKRATDVMLRLISDLRDVGCIEAGRLSLKTCAEDAGALVRDSVESIKPTAADDALRFDIQLPTEAIVIECDRVRVIQVLSNLLSNAIKFSPRGGTITISVEAVSAKLACFSVENTGCAISTADLPYVFDRYWQAKETAHLGTGLGLAIAKGIVEAHGGTTSVDSQRDHGTKFSFTIPLAHARSL